MKLRPALAEIPALVVGAAIVALVFQQIATDMAAQGIASGGPYDNAAAYPRALAIILAGLLLPVAIRFAAARPAVVGGSTTRRLARPLALLAIFALYLFGLQTVGYALATAPMLVAIMLLCGTRSLLMLVVIPLVTVPALSFVFEAILNVVLPRGAWNVAFPW